MRLVGMQHVWGRGEVRKEFWWGNLRGKEKLEDSGVCGIIIFKVGFQKVGWGRMNWIDLT